MAFSSEQRDQIIARLKGKVTTVCPMCGHFDWTLADDFVMLSVRAPVFFQEGSELPCVAMVCTTCGYTRLHNAIVLGLGGMLQGG
jgi:hypothetical protein